MGVDYPTQFSKLKEDEFLSSVIGLSPTTGSDGKQYEMITNKQRKRFNITLPEVPESSL